MKDEPKSLWNRGIRLTGPLVYTMRVINNILNHLLWILSCGLVLLLRFTCVSGVTAVKVQALVSGRLLPNTLVLLCFGYDMHIDFLLSDRKGTRYDVPSVAIHLLRTNTNTVTITGNKYNYW